MAASRWPKRHWVMTSVVIRKPALAMRGLDTDDVTFLTAPLQRYDTTEDGQGIVILDTRQSKVLWRTVANDKVARYLRRYGDESGALGDPATVG
jgi:hypothetical protein